jgi:hypothetical protein
MHQTMFRSALGIGVAIALVFVVPSVAIAVPTWSILPTPNPAGATNSLFHGVSCPTTSWCTAVGQSNSTGVGGAMAQTLSGASWSIDNVIINPEQKNAILYGVSCPLTGYCFAAGAFGSFAGRQEAMVQRKNGSSTWSLLPKSGEPSHSSSALYAISCVTMSVTLCEATGNHNTTGVGGASAFRGTDVSFTYDSSVIGNPGDKNGALNGVSCLGGTLYRCYGAGSYGDSGIGKTLIEAKTQVSGQPPELGPWTVQPAQTPATNHGFLAGVSCVSTSWCMAVGRQQFVSQPYVLSIGEKWDGSAWTLVGTDPAFGSLNARLSGVSCTSSSMCVAVGSYVNGSGTMVPMAQRWNGSTWALQSAPAPVGATASALEGVTCTSADACVGVGYYVSGGVTKTLAERLVP